MSAPPNQPQNKTAGAPPRELVLLARSPRDRPNDPGPPHPPARADLRPAEQLGAPESHARSQPLTADCSALPEAAAVMLVEVQDLMTTVGIAGIARDAGIARLTATDFVLPLRHGRSTDPVRHSAPRPASASGSQVSDSGHGWSDSAALGAHARARPAEHHADRGARDHDLNAGGTCVRRRTASCFFRFSDRSVS